MVDLLLLLPGLLLILLKLLLFLRHQTLQLLVVALMDARHPSQPDLVVLLGLQASLLLLFQLFNLLVGVLLELPPGLLMDLLGEPLLLRNPLDRALVLRLLGLELALHLGHRLGVFVHELLVLGVPVSVDVLSLGGQLLIAPHLDHHFVLEGPFQVLRLFRVQVYQALDVFVSLHVCVSFFLLEEFVLRPFRLNLLGVLLLELDHFLLMRAFSVPQLELDHIGQLLDLPLEFQQLRLLLV
mmetsp:Transcript_28041/g.84545  ORF Transcript_28041/g.84545 Transcript_28041/m.84545 type:complete len:240 (-) Transcript_28041:1958-2677(-)